jgi:transcriptional regulator with XRE-family HTH domain
VAEDRGRTRTEEYRVYDGRGIGNAIRHFRQTAELSQTELAERTAIPREYLVAIEHGLETKQVRRLFRLLRALDLELAIRRRAG